mgnify:CR=1 FL=1
MRKGLIAAALAALIGGQSHAADVRGVTATEITIGTYTDLSGVTAMWGVNNSNTWRMVFDEVNAAGGIHGRKIKYIVEDNQYQIPRSVQAANKLINKDNVFIMVANGGKQVIFDAFLASIDDGDEVIVCQRLGELGEDGGVVFGLVAQGREHAVVGLVSRDLGGVQPLAVDGLEEVVLRADRLRELGLVDARGLGHGVGGLDRAHAQRDRAKGGRQGQAESGSAKTHAKPLVLEFQGVVLALEQGLSASSRGGGIRAGAGR